MDRASCAGMDGNIFYPTVDGVWSKRNEKQAKATCAACPVRVQCIDWACSQRWEEQGYWGSDLSQRRRIRKLSDIYAPEDEYIEEFADDLVALAHA